LAPDSARADLYADRSTATDNATSARFNIAADKSDASSDKGTSRSGYSNADAYQ